MPRITTMREALRDAHRLLTEMSGVDGLTHSQSAAIRRRHGLEWRGPSVSGPL